MLTTIYALIGGVILSVMAPAVVAGEPMPSLQGWYEAACAAHGLEVRSAPDPIPGGEAGDRRDTLDCSFADGTAIRLRWAEDQAFSYGQCGGAPPEYMSLWINKRHVLTHRFIDNCWNRVLKRLQADAANVTICTYVFKDPRTHEEIAEDALQKGPVGQGDENEGRAPDERCQTIPVDRSAPIDPIEYPPVPHAVAPVGSLQEVMAEDPVLCGEVSAAGVGLPRGSTPVPWGPWKKPEYCGRSQRASFDFFNEGSDRDVYDWDLCTHAQDGDTYLVQPKGAAEPDVGVGEYHGDRAPPPANGRLLDLGYWHGQVFRRDNTTYIAARPVNDLNELYLWRPQPDGTLHKVCAWSRVQPHD